MQLSKPINEGPGDAFTEIKPFQEQSAAACAPPSANGKPPQQQQQALDFDAYAGVLPPGGSSAAGLISARMFVAKTTRWWAFAGQSLISLTILIFAVVAISKGGSLNVYLPILTAGTPTLAHPCICQLLLLTHPFCKVAEGPQCPAQKPVFCCKDRLQQCFVSTCHNGMPATRACCIAQIRNQASIDSCMFSVHLMTDNSSSVHNTPLSLTYPGLANKLLGTDGLIVHRSCSFNTLQTLGPPSYALSFDQTPTRSLSACTA